MEFMNVHDAIYERRSIRRFTEQRLSMEQIEKLVDAAAQAPSAKNRQPWFFYIVVDQKVQKELIKTLRAGVISLYEQYRQASISRPDILSAQSSLEAMEQAAAIIFVKHVPRYHTYHDDGVDWPLHTLDIEATDLLSIGAAVQNMLLVAKEMHLGALWVCDIFYAYPALKQFLKEDGSILSAVCLGYPAEVPAPRPRFSTNQISTVLYGEGE